MAREHETRGTSYDTKSRSYWLTVHYLGLGYPAETVAEIVGMSVEYVRGVEEQESRLQTRITTTGRNHRMVVHTERQE